MLGLAYGGIYEGGTGESTAGVGEVRVAGAGACAGARARAWSGVPQFGSTLGEIGRIYHTESTKAR